MSRSVIIRAGGFFAMLGGALFIFSSLTHPQGLARAAVPGSIVCLILGAIGLHAQLSGRSGWLGPLGLVLVGMGLALGLAGMAGSALGVVGDNLAARIINTGEHAGLVFIGAGLSTWGLLSLRSGALGRLSVLPLIAGILGMTGIAFLMPRAFAALEGSLIPLVFAAAWILLGYALLTSRTYPDVGAL